MTFYSWAILMLCQSKYFPLNVMPVDSTQSKYFLLNTHIFPFIQHPIFCTVRHPNSYFIDTKIGCQINGHLVFILFYLNYYLFQVDCWVILVVFSVQKSAEFLFWVWMGQEKQLFCIDCKLEKLLPQYQVSMLCLFIFIYLRFIYDHQYSSVVSYAFVKQQGGIFSFTLTRHTLYAF